MKIGIDKIGFYAPSLFVDLVDLAKARNIDPNKYLIGLGQSEMAICPITQDAVSMAANAAFQILTKEDIEDIELVIFATESGVDFSKSGATFVHGLLNLKPKVRSFEVKHACYSATAAIEMARGFIALNPNKKALILASDIARYGLNTGGEPTQGAGAIALLISNNPKLLEIENEHTYLTDDVLDFWKPNYSDVAFVEGHFSNQKYQESFVKVYNEYLEKTNRKIEDFKAICLHTPYTKIGFKTLKLIDEFESNQAMFENFKIATIYNKKVGNIYTGALYLSLLSLLENGNLNTGDRIGLYSYGSGSVAEFYSVIVVDNYKNSLNKDKNNEMLLNRKKLSIEAYEKIMGISLDGTDVILNPKENDDTGLFSFIGIENHKRKYSKNKL